MSCGINHAKVKAAVIRHSKAMDALCDLYPDYDPQDVLDEDVSMSSDTEVESEQEESEQEESDDVDGAEEDKEEEENI